MATLRPFLPEDAILTGLDPDPAETELAIGRGLYANVVTAGAERTPLADSSVDAIITNSVLEHIELIDQVLAECRRVLRPGGLFVATRCRALIFTEACAAHRCRGSSAWIICATY
jgi:ubiquinone/menaquinone biosynthesis C-methylase UbiE